MSGLQGTRDRNKDRWFCREYHEWRCNALTTSKLLQRQAYT